MTHIESHGPFTTLLPPLLAAAATQAAVGGYLGLYRGRFQPASFDEVPPLALTLTAVCAIAVLVDLQTTGSLPVSDLALGLLAGGVVQGGIRCLARGARDRQLRPPSTTARKVIVMGAGEGGVALVRGLLHDPTSDVLPVAFVDDDPRKQGLRIHGIEVEGGRAALPIVAARHGAADVVIAIPSARTDMLRELHDLLSPLGLHVQRMPSLSELLRGQASPLDVRDLHPADLLGRAEVEIDLASVASAIEGRCVLVTGAGGSIGSEICKQLLACHPARLVMLDRDESALHALQLYLCGRALLDDDNLVVADIRDKRRLDEVFRTVRPEVVFHAAALKHLTLLERHPSEAVKTNVFGTANVLEVAQRHGTHHFVNISTDKAATPTSVLGWSKRIGERITAGAAQQSGATYVSVRFGNVLGSRGSVLTAFRCQLAAGVPLTVTHPDVTRYFMTVEEAVGLVLQAAVVGRPGEVLVLDMGEPVRISDVAMRLMRLANRPIDIEYTGLRPGEKLHEVLLGDDETQDRPFHPLISHVGVPPLSESALSLLPREGSAPNTIQALRSVSAMSAPPRVIDVSDLRHPASRRRQRAVVT